MIRSFLIIASLALLATHQSALAADGKTLYQTSCVACHGTKTEGSIPGVPNLKTTGRLAQSDAVLVKRILNGFQTKGSPMAMPAKGGNPTLTAADAQAIVSYMRSITGTSALPARSKSAAVEDAPAVAPATATAAVTVPSPAPAAETVPDQVTAAESSPESSVVPAVQPDMTAFASGGKAWANNCARCHNMRDPKDLSDRQWKVIMTHMRLRAGLDGKQVRDITAFLQRSN